MSPRKRQPAPTDHAAMLDLALEDLQRTATLGRELLSKHPERAHAALDLLLFNVGCWEVRWLSVANDTTSLGAMPLADEEGVSPREIDRSRIPTLPPGGLVLGRVRIPAGRH